MLMYILPIVLIVTSNVIYNICQKSTPQGANPFSALLVTYLTAAFLTLIASFCYKTDKGFFHSFSELNWTSPLLGIVIVGLELGYLLAYRAGWNISVVTLVANIFLAVLLIPVGVLLYKEGFTPMQIAGAVFCVVGLILIKS